MAYNTNNFSLVTSGIFEYITNDTLATVTAAGYFSDFASTHSGAIGDLILIKDNALGGAAELPNNTTVIALSLSGNAATAGLVGGENLNSTAIATSDGLTTGTLTDLGKDFTVTVTSAGANNIIVLPAPVVGRTVTIIVGANGYELRSSAPATIAIGGGTGATAESAIPAASVAVVKCITATSWLGYTITAATLAAIEAAA
jgi:hypothetical protein